MPKTLTRLDMSEAVVREIGLSKNESGKLVERMVRHISDTVVNGEKVKISSFGTFTAREMAPRAGRNLATGETVRIGRRRVLVFKASSRLRKRVADGGKD